MDQLRELGADRDEGLAQHLMVGVAQVRRPSGVGGDAVSREFQRVVQAQTGLHEQRKQQPHARVGELVQVRLVLELGHHLFGKSPRGQRPVPRGVLGVDETVGRDPGCPSVTAGRGQEHPC